MPRYVAVDGSSRDPYASLLGQTVSVTLRTGLIFDGILDKVTYSFVRLQTHGETCVLRRDVIDVIRTTARADPPQARDVHAHGHPEVRKVLT